MARILMDAKIKKKLIEGGKPFLGENTCFFFNFFQQYK